jgi:hypothetical protein
MDREYPAEAYQSLVGRTIIAVADLPHSDEGFRILLDDQSTLDIGFSGNEGSIIHDPTSW